MNSTDVIQALAAHASPEKAKNSAWFFKTAPGQYGHGDQFVGVTVPEQRAIAKTYHDLPENELITLLQSPIHEHRLTALLILVGQYQRADAAGKKHLASLYHKQRTYVNNWDLVDSSASYILGDYLTTHSPNVLFRLAKSKSMWDRRIAIISTFAWFKINRTDMTMRLATELLHDPEDLIQKAVGWALREVGKRDLPELLGFLDEHAATMPRTTLRYAIERLTPEQRQLYMKKH